MGTQERAARLRAWRLVPRGANQKSCRPAPSYQCPVGVGAGDGFLDGAATRTTLNELSAWFLRGFSPVKRYSGQPL
jgi:hypothetical protein